MFDWENKLLGEFIELKRGYDLPSRDRLPGPFPLVSSSGPSELISQFKAKAPGVVTGRYGTVGQVFYVREDYWPLNTALYVRDFRGNDPRFVYYFLQGIDWAKFNDKSGVPGINRNDVHSEPVLVPSIVVQREISRCLGLIDDKIELNRRMNETLEGMAQAIFRDWFVDFGPTRRKAAGEADPVAIMGGLTPDPARATELAALFPAAFGDEGLPVGWTRVPVSKLIAIIGGGTPKTSNSAYWNGPIPWFSVTDTPAGKDLFVFDTEKSITQAGLDGSSARLVSAGTTIISARGTVGNLALAAQPMTFNQSCYALRSSEGERPYFTFLAAANLVEVLKGMAHGSVFSTITRQTFDGVNFADAGGAAMDAFEGTVAPLFNRIRAAVDENRTLAETRDYLLPRLMSGAVRVASKVEAA
ncbi:type I restriction enzyme S subunit [Novosphingobium sp. 1748]|uniref:restriction endonuclease subunit S n=1 Tax=Novosphingobium sp. 1748 TaxID=2817760 RepID=UPI00285738A7|nr:restriction endonuclease subunit S [Novosphingobium sp. 1748]MDR6708842.1 type I restriction enzyme S subunit [Novosphingobium sp. 1748]